MNERDDEDVPTLPSNFRLRPSRNQKQRSKLRQGPEPAPPPPPPPVETPPPPSAPPAPATFKKMRLKRSGQMHEDMTGPLPEEADPKKKETEY